MLLPGDEDCRIGFLHARETPPSSFVLCVVWPPPGLLVSAVPHACCHLYDTSHPIRSDPADEPEGCQATAPQRNMVARTRPARLFLGCDHNSEVSRDLYFICFNKSLTLCPAWSRRAVRSIYRVGHLHSKLRLKWYCGVKTLLARIVQLSKILVPLRCCSEVLRRVS